MEVSLSPCGWSASNDCLTLFDVGRVRSLSSLLPQLETTLRDCPSRVSHWACGTRWGLLQMHHNSLSFSAKSCFPHFLLGAIHRALPGSLLHPIFPLGVYFWVIHQDINWWEMKALVLKTHRGGKQWGDKQGKTEQRKPEKSLDSRIGLVQLIYWDKALPLSKIEITHLGSLGVCVRRSLLRITTQFSQETLRPQWWLCCLSLTMQSWSR